MRSGVDTGKIKKQTKNRITDVRNKSQSFCVITCDSKSQHFGPLLELF